MIRTIPTIAAIATILVISGCNNESTSDNESTSEVNCVTAPAVPGTLEAYEGPLAAYEGLRYRPAGSTFDVAYAIFTGRDSVISVTGVGFNDAQFVEEGQSYYSIKGIVEILPPVDGYYEFSKSLAARGASSRFAKGFRIIGGSEQLEFTIGDLPDDPFERPSEFTTIVTPDEVPLSEMVSLC